MARFEWILLSNIPILVIIMMENIRVFKYFWSVRIWINVAPDAHLRYIRNVYFKFGTNRSTGFLRIVWTEGRTNECRTPSMPIMHLGAALKVGGRDDKQVIYFTWPYNYLIIGCSLLKDFWIWVLRFSVFTKVVRQEKLILTSLYTHLLKTQLKKLSYDNTSIFGCISCP